MVETGKLKRLLVNKDSYVRTLYDIFHFDNEEIKNEIVQKVLIFNSFKA